MLPYLSTSWIFILESSHIVAAFTILTDMIKPLAMHRDKKITCPINYGEVHDFIDQLSQNKVSTLRSVKGPGLRHVCNLLKTQGCCSGSTPQHAHQPSKVSGMKTALTSIPAIPWLGCKASYFYLTMFCASCTFLGSVHCSISERKDA